MEIQTFTLAENISQVGGRIDGTGILAFGFEYPENKFPVHAEVGFAALLRRQHADAAAHGQVRLRLRRANGEAVPGPHDGAFAYNFPAERSFAMSFGDIHFLFPTAGSYRLELSEDADDAPVLFTYKFVIAAGPPVAAPNAAGG